MTGDPLQKSGMCIYHYSCNRSMNNSACCNADGDYLIVPQTGTLFITSEFGKLKVEPKEIVVIPRGIRFSVDINQSSRGWVCEIFNGHFRLPDLGPIGANCLANPRDFEAPVAWFEQKSENFEIFQKFGGKVFKCEMDHSPFDVVAWHGNYYPYKYNLEKFCTIGSISFDHPDPSIFTVLTCPSNEVGTAVCDFVIFPPRWLVGEHTFRPPYYHRNTMSEYMGNIYGVYDAKEKGFSPGCSSLHSCMTPHGPEAEVFNKASNSELKPMKLDGTMSFMFETCYLLKVNKQFNNQIDEDYWKCWQDIKNNFKAD